MSGYASRNGSSKTAGWMVVMLSLFTQRIFDRRIFRISLSWSVKVHSFQESEEMEEEKRRSDQQGEQYQCHGCSPEHRGRKELFNSKCAHLYFILSGHLLHKKGTLLVSKGGGVEPPNHPSRIRAWISL